MRVIVYNNPAMNNNTHINGNASSTQATEATITNLNPAVSIYNLMNVGKIEFDSLEQAACFMQMEILPYVFERVIQYVNTSNVDYDSLYIDELDLNHKDLSDVNKLLQCQIKIADKEMSVNDWAEIGGYGVEWIVDTCDSHIDEWLYLLDDVFDRMESKTEE